MRFVDANVFIYQFIQSPKVDFEISGKILDRIEGGEPTVTSLPVIQEVVKWLEYNQRRKEVRAFLVVINSYFSMTKIAMSWNDVISSSESIDRSQIGFVDSTTLQVMKQHKISEIYSNDKDFDRVDWVKRIWK